MLPLHKQIRSGSSRLSSYDYAQGGWYHLVACAADRHHSFGEVRNGIMGLSAAGCIATWAWPKTLSVYSRAVRDAFVVMPDHVHLLLGLRSRCSASAGTSSSQRAFGEGLIPHSVSSIMNHYKGRVTKTIHRYEACPGFAWQPRFYDRVIRSRKALKRHRRYVVANPVRWDKEGLPSDRRL